MLHTHNIILIIRHFQVIIEVLWDLKSLWNDNSLHFVPFRSVHSMVDKAYTWKCHIAFERGGGEMIFNARMMWFVGWMVCMHCKPRCASLVPKHVHIKWRSCDCVETMESLGYMETSMRKKLNAHKEMNTRRRLNVYIDEKKVYPCDTWKRRHRL